MLTNQMKKGIFFGAAVLLITATVAFAHDYGNRFDGRMMDNEYGYGHMMGRGGYNGHMGYGRHMTGYGPWDDRGYNNDLSEEDMTKLDQARESFYNDTRELRDQIREKRLNISRALDQKDPDAGKVTELQNELSSLESQFDQKRIEYQLNVRKLLPEENFSTGNGPRGRGGYCW